ncbi:MAG TPA: AAA family ATPase, partial [Thermomicrobiales bacterium]|nr:AAA family ATPase [Thermomicrobiales bacterium]
MFIRELELEEFRSYRRLDLQLEPAGLRLVGPNASGKSTLLEAVAMLATTRSPRATTERDLINWRSGEDFGVPPFFRARGVIVRGDGETTVEIGLQVDAGRPTATRKRIRVDERPVRASDAVGRLRAVLFSPEDVALVTNPPASRRRYLDLTIAQTDSAYLRALARFARVLEQRNSLLKTLHRERVAPRSAQAAGQLAFWDQHLVAEGALVIAG